MNPSGPISSERLQLAAQISGLLQLVDNSPFGIFAVDADFRVVQASAGARKAFRNVDPLIGRDLAEALRIVWPEPFASEAIGLFRSTLETGVPYHAPGTVERRRDIGAVESYDWQIERVAFPDGRFGVVCQFYDLSERQRYEAALRGAEQALREADRRKDEFLAVLAHELRAPLATMRTGVEILRRTVGTGPAQDRVLPMMERQVRYMGRLIEDLLDASRIGRGRIELRKERIDLWQPVRAALETSRPMIEEMQQTIAVAFPAEAAPVHADPTRMTQVFSNLLHNAARYTARGGHIEVRGERFEDEALVSVSDDGVGIAPADLESIFGMFVQLGGSPHARAGLGIGLALVKGLVQMHGGSIEAHSEGAGRGARFTVRLPLEARTAAAPPEAVAEPASAPPARLPLRVLRASRNREAAVAEARALGALGHAVHLAHDGEEAVRAMESFRPDVALLDVDLPLIDGYQVCRRIHARPRGAAAVLIAITDRLADHERRMSRAAGFDDYLARPVAPHALAELFLGLQRRRGAARAQGR